MFRFTTRPYDRATWQQILDLGSDVALTQCWGYGEARARNDKWRVERGIVERGGRAVAAAQVLIRTLPLLGGGLVWIGRGPIVAETPDLVPVFAALRQHYTIERGMYLRIAPPVPHDDLARAGFESSGFQWTTARGWASARVDLSADEAVIRAGLDQKWRNALNKAERAQLAVDRPPLAEFLVDYQTFLTQRGFDTTVTPKLLAALDTALDHKLMVLRARRDGRTLGAVVVVRFGRTAEYLAGTLTDQGRPFNVGQLLLWRAILDAKSDGCLHFDLGGMDPVLTPKGIYAFKHGVGGKPYQYANEIEGTAGLRGRIVRWRVARARAAG